MQLKEISPKIIEHERCIRRLEDSQQKAQVEDAVAQRGVNELKERMDELIETHELSAEVQRGTSSLLEDFKEEKSKELRQELLGLQDVPAVDFRRSMEATMKDEAREVEQEAQLKKLKVLEAQLTETKAHPPLVVPTASLPVCPSRRSVASTVGSTVLLVTALSSAGHQHRTCFARARARGVGLAAGGDRDAMRRQSQELAQRQEIEERLQSMREKMEAIRSKSPDRLPIAEPHAGDLEGTVLWCDSDPTVLQSCGVLRGSGLNVEHFQEPEAALQRYLRSPQEERGAMNGYALFEALQRAAAARRRPKPLLAMISCSADATKAQEAGADLVVLGNRIKAQNLVVTRLRQSMGLQAGYVGES
eukprot:g22229.t1